MSRFDWEDVVRSKHEWNARTANLPLAEKFALLDRLRARSVEMRSAVWTRSSTVQLPVTQVTPVTSSTPVPKRPKK
mgnify:CR=1 FL=1|jgi:hypothetical protein